jgi:hypothetical protein
LGPKKFPTAVAKATAELLPVLLHQGIKPPLAAVLNLLLLLL